MDLDAKGFFDRPMADQVNALQSFLEEFVKLAGKIERAPTANQPS